MKPYIETVSYTVDMYKVFKSISVIYGYYRYNDFISYRYQSETISKTFYDKIHIKSIGIAVSFINTKWSNIWQVIQSESHL